MAAQDVKDIINENKQIRDDIGQITYAALSALASFVDRNTDVPRAIGVDFPEVPASYIEDHSNDIRSRIDSNQPRVTDLFINAASISTLADMNIAGVNPTAPAPFISTPVSSPTFGAAPATIAVDVPVAPTVTAPSAPGAAPGYTSPAAPVKPTYTLPSAPNLTAVAIPVFSGLSLPTFTSTLPIDNITTPTNQFSYAEPLYVSAIQDTLKAKILNDLQNGGYGIETADELRIWDRARERDTAALGATMDEIARASAARGFSMPPGTFYAATLAAASEAAMKVSSMSRDIASKRADLYVQNRQFMMETGVSFEKLLIDFFNSKAERALNVAKLTVQLGIEVFNAQVAKYNMLLEAYKTQANVYEIQIRAELAKLEEYKGRLEGARISADINRISVDTYRVQVEAVTALMKLYQTDVDVMKTKAEIENMKLTAYRSQVEAYAASVQAYTARWNAYEAQIRGEVAKAQVYEAQVRGYTGTIEAEKAKIDAQRAKLEADIAAKNVELATFKANVEWWLGKAKTKIDQVNAAGGVFSTSAQTYAARIQGEKAAVDSQQSAQKITAELAQEKARATTQQLIAQTELLIKGLSINETAAAELARTAQQTFAAILTAISGVVTLSS